MSVIPILAIPIPTIASADAHAPVRSTPSHLSNVLESRAASAVAVGHWARPFRQIGVLVVPRLKLRTPIYLGITDDIFDVGVGQWPGTAKPGKPGNIVLGGHRTGAMMPFLNIDKMRKGDKIRVIVGRKTFTYTVTTKRIIKPTDVSITRQTATATLTLFTCHPPHSIKQRYVVRATLTS